MNGYYTFSEHLKTNEFSLKLYTYAVGVTVNTVSNTTQQENIFNSTITFPEGAYSASSLTPVLQTLINNITSQWQTTNGNQIPPSTSTLTPPENQIIQVTYNAIKAKFYFMKQYVAGAPANTNNHEPRIQTPFLTATNLLWGFDLDFRIKDDPTRDVEKNLGWLLGYEKSIYYWNTDYNQLANTASQNILLRGFNPQNILDFTGTKFFLLEITDYNKNYSEVFKYNTYKRNINYKDILAKIPNTAATTNIIFEDSSDRVFKTRKYFGPVRISKLRIRLLDDYGRVVNLNGGDLVISLEIETLNMPYKNFRQ
jgi:hypothetical protein